MSETLHGHDQLPQPVVPIEMVSNQAEAHEECRKACAHLSAEVNDELNQTPAGRLHLLCIEENLVLAPKHQSILLSHPKLAKFLNKPGPLKGGRKKLCLKIIHETTSQAYAVDQILDEDESSTDTVNSKYSKIVATQRQRDQEITALEAAKTSEFEVNQDLEVANTVIDDIFQNHVTVGTLTEIRLQLKQGLEDNPEIMNTDTAMKEAEAKYIAPHEARLSALQSVFTPQEVHQLFGGNLAETVSVNLQGESNAVIYADVFTKIDAGITDDSRKQVLRSRVEKQLGIKPHPVDVKSGGDINEVYKRGYGVETYVDENGIIQERSIPMSPDFEVEYKDGHKLGVDKQGDKYLSILTHVGQRFRIPLPANPRDDDMGNIIRTAETRAMLHSMNMAEAFYSSVTIEELDGGEMKIYPSDYLITERILSPLLGNRAMAGNDLLSMSDIEQGLHLLQFQSEKGDAVQGDLNPEQVRNSFMQQGAMNKDGMINWENFTQMVEANRNGLHLTEENIGETEQRKVA